MPEKGRDQKGTPPDEATAEGGNAAQATEAVSEDSEALRKELEEVTRKGQEYLGLAQRAQADLQNYRRRVEQERGEHFQSGKAELALALLPVLDDFDRAIKAKPTDLSQNEWAQGVNLIARKLRAALEAQSIVPIDALGQEFNPWEHEAMMHAPSSPEEEGKVTEVFRDGYKLGNKLLRPAQVKVGRGA